jgi:conjugative transfer signal peptidase TraF
VRTRTVVAVGAAALACLALAQVANSRGRSFLWNTSPSEPPGLYVRTSAPVQVGRLVAFLAPPAAYPYADRRLAYLRQVPIIKAVGAGEGTLVCTSGGALAINGHRRAAILAVDSQGVSLPHWRDCRRLRKGEVFVFSDRVRGSFDSRYFGPVDQAKILGVYRPLFTL